MKGFWSFKKKKKKTSQDFISSRHRNITSKIRKAKKNQDCIACCSLRVATQKINE